MAKTAPPRSPGASRREEARRQAQRRRQQHLLLQGGLVAIAVVVVAVAAWWLIVRAGESDSQVLYRFQTQDFHSLAIDPIDPDTLYLGHHGGLLVSRDGGRTWQSGTLSGVDAMQLALPAADPERIYASGHGVFVVSQDGGQTWAEVTAGALLPVDGAGEILLKADLKVVEGHEPSVVTGIDWVFVAEREKSERYTFTGKERDATGLYYFGARYYDPEVARWTTVDPLRVGNNWYEYCYSNPLRFIDQTGKWPGETMHNKETVKIAYAMGFNLVDAVLIGSWCKSVDYQVGTLPFPGIGDLSWHFDMNKNPNIDTRIVHSVQCLALAKQAIDKGDKDEALKWIGMGLHAVQDISAHANFYPLQDPYFHPKIIIILI